MVRPGPKGVCKHRIDFSGLDLSAALDITQEDVYFMEAKSTFVQLLRTLPPLSAAFRRPLNLQKIADTAATTKDMGTFRKGIRGLELLKQ
jgi:Ras GTPase-activating-like protein IQGAP2/3